MNRQEITKNFLCSIEQERIKLQLTQAQMAERLGISTSGYKKIIAGETTKIDLYTGYMMYSLTGKPIFELCGDTNPTLTLLQKFKELTPTQQKFIELILDFELDFKNQNTDSTEDYVTLLRPTGNFEDGMIWDSADFSKYNISAYRKQFGSLIHCAIQVNSNHLNPVYLSGDILLICKKPPRDGDTGIFINRKEGRAYLRRFRQTHPCRLEPINGYGETFYVDGNDPEAINEWIKFGCVLTKVR